VLFEHPVQLDEATARGVIAYEDEGRGADAVVLLHGFACNRLMWRAQLDALRPAYRTLVIDLPGHGASQLPPNREYFTEDSFADMTVDLLRSRSVDRAVFVGFSMGGGVALNVATRHPSMVAGLVLADVGGGSTDVAAHRTSVHQLGDLLRRDGMGAFVGHLLAMPIFASYADRSVDARAHMRRMLMQGDPLGLEQVIRGVLAERKPIQDRALQTISVPTEVVVGEHDLECRVTSSMMAERIPIVNHTIIGGAGHMTPMEAPDAFNRLLDNCLRQIFGGPGAD
jgi:pimeloyl-ACP methyl ester carboxylesterase